jgi:serine protease Do
MKKNIFLAAVLVAGISLSSQSQAQDSSAKDKSSQEIVIRKNGDGNKKMIIEIDGDNVTINGKSLSDYHGGDVSVIQKDMRDRGSDNFLFAPDDKNMDMQLFRNDFNSDKPHTFLGVLTTKVDDGVKVTQVVKGSSAEKAGLAEGDVITKLGDKKIASPENLSDAVLAYKPNNEVKIYYLRDNKKKDTQVKLGESKQLRKTFNFRKGSDMNGSAFNFKMPEMREMPGMQHQDFNFFSDTDKPKLGVKIEDTENDNGVKVLSVEEGSAADKAGIKKDDIITELNGEKVTDVNDTRRQINEKPAGENLKIKAMRNNAEMNFEVKIPKQLNNANL